VRGASENQELQTGQCPIFFFLPSPLGFRQVDPHAIFACSMFCINCCIGIHPSWPQEAVLKEDQYRVQRDHNDADKINAKNKTAKRNNSKPKNFFTFTNKPQDGGKGSKRDRRK
jgi:hypothetical protein